MSSTNEAAGYWRSFRAVLPEGAESRRRPAGGWSRPESLPGSRDEVSSIADLMMSSSDFRIVHTSLDPRDPSSDGSAAADPVGGIADTAADPDKAATLMIVRDDTVPGTERLGREPQTAFAVTRAIAE